MRYMVFDKYIDYFYDNGLNDKNMQVFGFIIMNEIYNVKLVLLLLNIDEYMSCNIFRFLLFKVIYLLDMVKKIL
jgi:hypothetical protein